MNVVTNVWPQFNARHITEDIVSEEENDLVSGIDITGVLDSTAALQALIQPNRGPAPFFGYTRKTVDLPNGAEILISSRLEITTPVHIRMNGARIFCKAPFCDMFVIRSTAGRTIIEDGQIMYWMASVQLQDNDNMAIRVEAAQFCLRDLQISGGGYGVWLVQDVDVANVNWPFFSNVEITGFRRQGLTVRGVDASSGTFLGVKCFVGQNHYDSTNHFGPAVGFEESSANGSTYVGCNIELTGSPEVSLGLRVAPTGGAAPSTFVGMYVEEGDQVEWVGNYALQTTTVGGHLARRFETKGDRVGCLNSRLTFHEKDINNVSYSMKVPAAEQLSAFSFGADVTADNNWFMKRILAADGVYRWAFIHYYNPSNPVLGLEATNLGSGSWDIAPQISALQYQIISGSGSWNTRSRTIFVEGTGIRTIALPNPSPAEINTEICVIDAIGNSALGSITLDPASSATINNQSTLILSGNFESAILVYNATNSWLRKR